MTQPGETVRRVELRGGDPAEVGAELIAVQAGGVAARRADEWLGGALSRWVEAGGTGREREGTRLFATRAAVPDVLAVGDGREDLSGTDRARRLGALGVREAREGRYRSVAASLEPGAPGRRGEELQACAEGLVVGDWRLLELRSPERREPAPPELGVVHLSSPREGDSGAVQTGRLCAEAQNFARTLVALPGNVVTPAYLASCAEELGRRHGLAVQCWGRDRLAAEGFGALLAVARGSEEEPRLLILDHPGEGGPPLVLVGKGVTFDSGGISLKPAQGMESMKYDMAGGAAVLGALQAVAALGLRRRVVGLVPAAENLPSGRALKPGDVIRGVAGLSIEIVSTDAEGRLLLSDALAFARRLEPEAMVDLATLTGACVVALGRHAIGLMSNDDELADRILVAGERAGERAWRLPLWPGYRKQLDSEIADIKNSGGREAGAITAGWFLREFAGASPWAHLDIAGTAWAEEASGWQPKGPTGVGVRLLVEWLRASAQPPD